MFLSLRGRAWDLELSVYVGEGSAVSGLGILGFKVG